MGESLLAAAGREKDPHKKHYLIQEASGLLSSDPRKVNLDSVLKTLVDNDKFEELVNLCLRKVKALQKDLTPESRDPSNFLEPYDIII